MIISLIQKTCFLLVVIRNTEDDILHRLTPRRLYAKQCSKYSKYDPIDINLFNIMLYFVVVVNSKVFIVHNNWLTISVLNINLQLLFIYLYIV